MKKILISIGILMTMSFGNPENKTNWEFMGLNSPVEIDIKLKEYFDLKIVEYTGDNSIFILGNNKKQ